MAVTFSRPEEMIFFGKTKKIQKVLKSCINQPIYILSKLILISLSEF